uniref:Uncharacterized protein n=1 Tax=Glossina palpalis gambiensis TaxID=67801 RepID=A0A1B0B211_9MUSC
MQITIPFYMEALRSCILTRTSDIPKYALVAILTNSSVSTTPGIIIPKSKITSAFCKANVRADDTHCAAVSETTPFPIGVEDSLFKDALTAESFMTIYSQIGVGFLKVFMLVLENAAAIRNVAHANY